MRILHTADWHMNNRLGRVDISPHIVDGLEQIAAILDHERVDVMIVAGDLFSERSGREGLRTAIGEIRRVFGPFLGRGGHIVAISGNHDSELFFETLRDALDLASSDGNAQRLHLTASPQTLVLRDSQGISVQFVLLPYPTARCYLRSVAAEFAEEAVYSTLEEKNRLIQANVARTLEALRARLDPTQPAVLVSHVHVRGATGHTLYKITENDDVIFDPQLLGEEWAYVAYGHIHKAGAVEGGLEHARYSGSVARLDAAERDDSKGVVLVDIGPQGREGVPRVVDLRARAMHQIHIAGADEMVALEQSLLERYPDAREALVHLTLGYRLGVDNLPAMMRASEKLFPFWYDRKIEKLTPINAVGGAIVASLSNAGDVAGTVRDYLKERFEEHTEREALLQYAEELLAR